MCVGCWYGEIYGAAPIRTPDMQIIVYFVQCCGHVVETLDSGGLYQDARGCGRAPKADPPSPNLMPVISALTRHAKREQGRGEQSTSCVPGVQLGLVDIRR